MIIILVIVLPFSALSTFFYLNTKNVMNNEIDIKNLDEIRSMRRITDNILKEMDVLTAVLLNYDDVYSVLMLNEADLDLSQYRIEAMNQINMFKIMYPFVRSIYIYSELNQYVLTHSSGCEIKDFADKNWMAHYNNVTDNSIVVFARTFNEATPNTLTVMRPLISDKENKHGAVMVNLDINALRNSIGDTKLSQLFLTDENGDILYSTFPSRINTNISEYQTDSKSITIDNEKYKLFGENSSEYNFKYNLIVAQNSYNQANNHILSFILLMIVFTALVCVGIASYITRRTFKPIKTIIQHIDKYYDEEMFQNDSDLNELSYIVKGIVDLNTNSDRMTKELEQSCILLNDMQILALQSQINPHFLYNTLEALQWMIIKCYLRQFISFKLIKTFEIQSGYEGLSC